MGTLPLLQDTTHYTFADYRNWNTDERYELVAGTPYLMSPAPGRIHQDIVGELFRKFRNHLDGKSCRVYVAPIDVRLNANDKDDTVLQPDLLVVCDRRKLDEHGVKGAPDLVMEVLSPSTRNYDTTLKLNIYMKAGVKECWLVDTWHNLIRVYTWDESGEETVKVYRENDVAPVGILPGFTLTLKEVFDAARL